MQEEVAANELDVVDDDDDGGGWKRNRIDFVLVLVAAQEALD